MIRSFRHKGLAELWAGRRTAKIDKRLYECFFERLDTLDAVGSAEDMNAVGFDFHQLRGLKPPRYTVHVNGPWCVTFEFVDGDALRVDLEQYH
jgi:toxin HigB-1